LHHVVRAADIRLVPASTASSRGYRRCDLVDRSCGSVHMELALCELDADGRVDAHVHSFEESFYVLGGSLTLVRDGTAVVLEEGSYGVVPVGLTHALAAGEGSAWIEMRAPQPRVGAAHCDTFFVGGLDGAEPLPLDLRDPRVRNLSQLVDGQMELESLRVGARIDSPSEPTSMDTAVLAYSGITVKMLVDRRLGAQLQTMFMVEYLTGAVAHPHDHPLEEAYHLLEGELEAVADGERFVLSAGDTFWTGVGCTHSFRNTSGRRVRFVETQAPQPPSAHAYRFDRDWDYLETQLEPRAAEPALPG